MQEKIFKHAHLWKFFSRFILKIPQNEQSITEILGFHEIQEIQYKSLKSGSTCNLFCFRVF